MSNQRRGKMTSAALNDSINLDVREVIRFMETSARELDDCGEQDASFYFEQVASWLKSNPTKGLKDPSRILGL